MKTSHVGQLWEGNDRKLFRITEITQQDTKAWVRYINVKTQEEYSCFLEAFEHRFTARVE
jgi:hypothetical protein